MKEASVTLTIYFDSQFYVGLFERVESNKLCVCRYVFGAEPKDYDVYELIKSRYYELKFSPSVELEKKSIERKNPKVRQRKIKKSIVEFKLGTKSQQAVQRQIEERNMDRKAKAKAYKMQNSDNKFLIRQEKKKQKRKGH